MDYNKEFQKIGEEIETVWRRRDYDPAFLPDLAMAAAAKVPEVDTPELIRQMSSTYDLNYSFSSYDMHVFRNENLRIEILHWLTNPTSIHEHIFCGAFRLMKGRSLQVEHEFTPAQRLTYNCDAGHLTQRHSEVLNSGDIRPIISGSDFIHANFHLGRPTVTMVIRSVAQNQTLHQYTYLPPYLRYDPFYKTEHRKRLCARLEYMAQIGQSGSFEVDVLDIINTAAFDDVLEALMYPRVSSGDEVRLARLIDAACQRFPDAATALSVSLWEVRRRERLTAQRRQVEVQGQRFLMALMINLSDTEAIRGHLAEEFADETPGQSAARILREMGGSHDVPVISQDTAASFADFVDGNPYENNAALDALLALPLLRPFLA